MGLKIATFQYIDQAGATQNALMTWKGADIDLHQSGSVRFAVYENAIEQKRRNIKDVFVMGITPTDVMTMFTKIGNVALEVSDVCWDQARVTKFIPSRVIETLNGIETVSMALHSLDDLKATITDIGI